MEEEKKKILLQIDELKKNDPFSDPDHASDNAAVDTDVREQVGHDTIEAEIKDIQKRVQNIDLALKKIQKNSYGVCERCRNLIPLARLKLILEAQHCIDCEKKLRR
ncbi:MAG: DnaK suppressor protein [Candidatus Roizmanbacteria bacterium GW2011_GWA2_36_23]|uniref:DnaK suppressor protein n=1 Tax=Candidatus Roizmanbacteria bacterium GW2011_GWA2_36_23 TaxID=1618480 RepID=A0A0G0E7E8_9BACT|nr:MAG: DnaK suppressor protein [Candidatus Roizmanbacteria bacterium GW2011_GWA2_36_23]